MIPIHLPPLRERGEDISLLANYFIASYGKRYDCPARIHLESRTGVLHSLEWKGNVRELQHAVERAVVLCRREVLAPTDFAGVEGVEVPVSSSGTLEDHIDKKTREYLLEVLDRTKWRKGKAAEILGVDRATLYRMLKKYSFSRESR